MMTRFYCLPAQAIQAPRLFCSTQSSYPCCSWTHTPRQWALSTCLVCLAQHRPADELCAELDWTRLSRRREVVFLRISRAKPQCRDSKKGAGETANSFCSRQWPKQPVTRLDCVPANGSNDLLVDSFRTDGASSDEERTGNYADRVTPSTSGYVEKGFYISPKEGQRVRDCPVDRLHELLLVAQQELENARANSAKLEETAQRIAEEAFVVRDQAVEAENAASDAQLNLDITVKEEARLQDAAERARAVFTSAGVKVMLAEDALAEVLDKLNADQSDQAIRQLRTSVALYPAEVPLASKGLMVNTSLESIASEQKFVRNAGASGNSEENAPQVMAFVNESEEVTFSPVTQSGFGDIAGDGQNGMSPSNGDAYQSLAAEKGEELSRACAELRHAESEFQKLEDDLARTRILKAELLKLTTHLSDVARQVRENASSAHDDAAYAMSLAEQAVAWEVEAAQRLSDAEMALQKAETHAADAAQAAATVAGAEMAQRLASQVTKASELLVMERDPLSPSAERTQVASEACDNVTLVRDAIQSTECSFQHAMADSAEEFGNSVSTSNAGHKGHVTDTENKVISETESDSRRLDVESISGDDNADKPKVPVQLKRPEVVKETTSPGIPKAAKRSSRFFSASYFSFAEDGAKFFPSPLFSGLAVTMKQQLPKVVIGIALLLAGGFVLNNQLERQGMVPPSDSMSSVQDVTTNANLYSLELSKFPRHMKKLIDKLPLHKVNEEETSLFDVLWLLLASVIFVPIFQNMPGGSPVLGYLAAGVLIGPYTLSIIQNVHGTKAIAEFGVVFLLFNIGLELSVERLSSMKKYVFGFGSSQVLCTALCIGLFAHQLSSISVPAAIVIGNGLALSSTAVVLQVLQERGESTSRHGRATFSVLLFQDLAVVVLLILIPLVSPNSSKGGVGLQAIGEALGIAAIKGVIAISGIIAGGRLLLRPVYKRMAENHNPEIFAANTLLIVLGTSLLTARAGLSMALGAFLAGLLLAETEYALQVESDIAPYRGLLLGLFFMTVGMSIDPKLFIAKFPVIFGALALLLCGKTLLVACVGRQFGLSTVAAVRAGLLLSPGGEFAFVAFGEAVNQGIMSSQLSSLLFLVVGLSMALTPWLAAGGQLIASRFEQQDVRSLLPAENETDDLQDHIIICGFGRVGQIIGQLLAERLIPFVALDVRSERVNMGRALDLPVYFGDAGSREVLHKVGAERAAAAVITLDTPGANYRTVWALSKHFPRLKTFVRAHDIDHGISLEKAGATAVVPEILEPSLQLAAAVLAQAKLPASEIAATIDDFRSRHLSELSELSEASGTSLGYGFSKIIAKPKPSSHEGIAKGRLKNDDGSVEIADGGIVSVGI